MAEFQNIPIDINPTASRYTRTSFYAAGQDDYTAPPAQDPDSFVQLWNTAPVTKGPLSRRFGYKTFATGLGFVPRKIYSYRGNPTGGASRNRYIYTEKSSATTVTNESGTITDTGLFTPTTNSTGSTALDPRAVTSRDYVYFVDGAVSKGTVTVSSTTTVTRTAGDNFTTGNFWKGKPIIINGQPYSIASVTSSTVLVLQSPGAINGASQSYAVADDLWRWDGEDSNVGVQAWGILAPTVAPAAALVTSGTGTIDFTKDLNIFEKVTGSAFPTDGSWNGLSLMVVLNEQTVNSYTIAPYDAGAGDSATRARITSTFDITSTGLTYAVATTGNVTLTVGRKYYSIFYSDPNTTLSDGSKGTGHYSDLSPISADISGLNVFSNGKVTITSFPVTADPQVTHWLLLATKDGNDPTTLYLVKPTEQTTGFIPIAYASTLTDNFAELNLLASSVYLETDQFGLEHGVTGNTPLSITNPPASLLVSHRGRLYTTNGPSIYFSKNVSEQLTSTNTITGRWEESWPGDYVVNLPTQDGSEIITGLLSDGANLYIGTQHAIYRLVGDPILNESTPEQLFNNAGVLNQEVWKMVYLEGAPVGAMWLTADGRVLLSDMNTYTDVGIQIQAHLSDILVTDTYRPKAWAIYYGKGANDLYVLNAVTTGQTEPFYTAAFSLRTKKWIIWVFNDQFTAGIYDVFPDGSIKALLTPLTSGKVYQTDETIVTDIGNDFTVAIKTPWLDLGDPLMRKYLNEVEVFTDDAVLVLNAWGADIKADFSGAHQFLSNATPSTSELGDYKYYLAGKAAHYKFYQFQFLSTTHAATDVLLAMAVEYVPVTRF